MLDSHGRQCRRVLLSRVRSMVRRVGKIHRLKFSTQPCEKAPVGSSPNQWRPWLAVGIGEMERFQMPGGEQTLSKAGLKHEPSVQKALKEQSISKASAGRYRRLAEAFTAWAKKHLLRFGDGTSLDMAFDSYLGYITVHSTTCGSCRVPQRHDSMRAGPNVHGERESQLLSTSTPSF